MTYYFELNNGKKIPQVGFGTWQSKNGEEAENAVLWALENGYDHIDTAAIYGNEESVGNAIKKSGRKREDLFITTKLWNNCVTYDDTIAAVKESLRKLQTDYIDLYLIHWPNPKPVRDNWQQRNADCYRAMEDLYEQGVLKAIGISNFSVHHIAALEETWRVVPQVNQIFITPGQQNLAIIDYCQDKDITLEAYSPLGRGHVVKSPVMTKLADKYGKTPAQLAVRWCIQLGYVPLPKSVTFERIVSNNKVFDFEISKEDMEIISNLEGAEPYGNPDAMDF